MKAIRTIAFVFLVIHLFMVNSKLIYHINPDVIPGLTNFSFLDFKEWNIVAMAAALCYSIMTVYLINSFNSYIKGYLTVIIWFALLDGLGVFIYYKMPKELISYGAFYYGLYTTSIIICMGLQKYIRKMSNHEKIMSLSRKGRNYSDIAKMLKLSQGYVHKVIENGGNHGDNNN